MGRITEMRMDMDGNFELTAEFDAGEVFGKFESNKEFLKQIEYDLNKTGWMPSLWDPDVYEIELGDIYDKLGIPCFNRRAHVCRISKYDIRHIYHNNSKNVTVVVWETGDKTKVKLADGETSNIYNAVSAAVMERKYGSNSAFKSRIEKNLAGYWDTAYLVIAMWETSEIYGGIEKFRKIVDEKLVLNG